MSSRFAEILDGPGLVRRPVPERYRKAEALADRGATPGERQAGMEAMKRIIRSSSVEDGFVMAVEQILRTGRCSTYEKTFIEKMQDRFSGGLFRMSPKQKAFLVSLYKRYVETVRCNNQ
jgi:hypothetical protein